MNGECKCIQFTDIDQFGGIPMVTPAQCGGGSDKAGYTTDITRLMTRHLQWRFITITIDK